jgi:hypothetical protein
MAKKGHRSFARARRERVRKQLVLIATEGERTEPLYFNGLRSLAATDTQVIHILGSRSSSSSPKAVLKRLREESKKKGATEEDICWMVVDRNSWLDEQLEEATRECRKSGYGIALSNPCFELWLVLHLQEEKTPLTCGLCASELERQLGAYQKNDYAVEELLPGLQEAVARAQRIDTDRGASVPGPPVTRVYRLVELLHLK